MVIELDLIAQRAVAQVEMEGKNIPESGNCPFLNLTLVRKRPGEFPGHPGVRILRFYCQGPTFRPWSEN